MRLVLVGKYPPIQGGVSARTYWTARWLAARGHDVHVVTNADEVEPAFRIALQPGDDAWLEPPGVRVWRTSQHGPSARHIPDQSPFVTKLASLATAAVEACDADAIVSHYLEPYAVAAHLAATFTDRPLIVRHAGSDVGRLMLDPQLRPCYEGILRRAALVCGSPSTLEEFAAAGVGDDRLHRDPGSALPVEVFHPGVDPVRLVDAPAIGIYGKVGPAKGTYDLVAAVGALRDRGVRCDVVALCGGDVDSFRRAVADAGLAGRFHLFPFVAPWRVPGMLKGLRAACFLERDFPITRHGPGIPEEVLAVGTPLVTSLEIARKQSFAPALVDGHNVLIVRDPRDHDELAAAIERLVADPDTAAAIGKRGAECLTPTPVDDFLDRYEAMVRAAGHQTRTAPLAPRRFALARRLLGEPPPIDETGDRFLDAVNVADGYADRWLAAVDDHPPYTADVLRWELAHVHDDDLAAATDELFFRPAAPTAVRLAPNAELVELGYDMPALAAAVLASGGPPADWPAQLCTYVFVHLPGRTRAQVVQVSAEAGDVLRAVVAGEAFAPTPVVQTLLDNGILVACETLRKEPHAPEA